jgi:hypothetical protein
MKAKIIMLILGIAVLIYCVVSVMPALINQWQFSVKSREELNSLSSRLGVEADWEAVRNKIYCDVLIEGETLDTIETDLRKITSIHVVRDDDQNPYYTIYFTKPYVILDDVGLDFDDNGHLIRKFRRVGLGDMTSIDCP